MLPPASEFQEIGATSLTSRLLSSGKDFPNTSFCFPSLQYLQPRDVRDPEEGTPEPWLNLTHSVQDIQVLKKAAVGLELCWRVSSQPRFEVSLQEP